MNTTSSTANLLTSYLAQHQGEALAAVAYYAALEQVRSVSPTVADAIVQELSISGRT